MIIRLKRLLQNSLFLDGYLLGFGGVGSVDF